MRKITFRMFCGMTLILLGFAAQAQYCVVAGGGSTASPTDFTLRNIADVTTTGGTTNINYAGPNGPNGYLLSTETLTIPRGQTFNLALTPEGSQGPGMRFIVYIDWNQDEDFGDAGEVLPPLGSEATWTDPIQTFDADIAVPGDAKVGLTRMRILGGDSWVYNDDTSGADVNGWGPGYPLSPCGDYLNASWKDFNLMIDYGLSVGDDISQNLGVAVFPNPLQGGAVRLKMNVQNQKVTVSLYNLVGEQLQTVAYESFHKQADFELPLSLSKGVYLMKVAVGDQVHSHKLVK